MAKRFISTAERLEMWEELEEIQLAFPDTEEGFLSFADHVIHELIVGHPTISRLQHDMSAYLYSGPLYRVCQALRGLGKTTLAAILAVFKIIHDPSTRVLIVSAGSKMAKEIAGWIIQILEGLDFLSVLAPDTASGDRSSIESYDIHYVFRGAEKAPSVKCMGLTSSLQGSRADLLLADDIESSENSRTAVNRELLEDRTKEFETINTHGDIVYLGTPQTAESIYSNLPARGYGVRVWPARYPSEEEEKAYGEHLSPMLVEDMRLDPSLRTGYGVGGQQGAPTCPEQADDAMLTRKQGSIGASKFMLQYMLSTSLNDEQRFPLKLSDLICMSLGMEGAACNPMHSTLTQVQGVQKLGGKAADFLNFGIVSGEVRPYEDTIIYIDVAGAGADEAAYAIVSRIGSMLFVRKVGAATGGYSEEALGSLIDPIRDYNVKTVITERNFGDGAYAAMLKPVLFKAGIRVDYDDVWVSTQKEIRIIDTLEPLLNQHRIVIDPQVFLDEQEQVKRYSIDLRVTYRLSHQLSNITRDRGALRHDDRLDALEGACQYFVEIMDFDNQTEMKRRKENETQKWMAVWSDPKKLRQYGANTEGLGGPQVAQFGSQTFNAGAGGRKF